MPTTNWIWEAASDAYYEATDPPPAEKRRTELACPFCNRNFASEDAQEASRDLASHIARNHPLLRPVLVVAGRMLGPSSVITRMPSPSDVVIENATSIEIAIDGGPFATAAREEAAQVIAASPRRMLNLRLVNQRVEDSAASFVDYRIKLDVANRAELDSVDEAFVKYLAREDVGRDDVMRFSNETDGVANFYRDGLASYVLGVFAKDGTSEDSDRLERALAAFGRAAFHLDDFGDRRVAAAVATCARLNLNDLGRPRGQTGVAAVDLATGFLRDLSTPGDPPGWPSRPVSEDSGVRCPVDEATYDFLELVFWLSDAEPNGWLRNELERIEHGTLTSPDRSKFAVVLGEWAARRSLSEVAERCAAILYNDPIFETAVIGWGV